MQTGTIISGIGHVGLIGWVLLGGVFASDPPEMEFTPVAVISAEQFAAMTSSPQTVAEPVALAEPEVVIDAPEAPEPETAPERTAATEAEAPRADATPQAIPTPPARPEPVEDQVAVLQPPPEPAPSEGLRDLPARRPVDRVAPTPVAPPPPEATPSEQRQEAVTPEAGETPTPQELRDASAPEEAATEIVTEAEAGRAPDTSRRPPARPQPRTAAAPPQEPSGETPRDDTAEAIAAALAQAQPTAAPQPPPEPAPAGPPLSSGEKDALVGKIGREWRVDPGSRAASVTVVVEIELTEDGRLASSPRLMSANSSDDTAVQVAFRSARTAIIAAARSGGFDLPRESYDSWRTIEMTFNPESMRIK